MNGSVTESQTGKWVCESKGGGGGGSMKANFRLGARKETGLVQSPSDPSVAHFNVF